MCEKAGAIDRQVVHRGEILAQLSACIRQFAIRLAYTYKVGMFSLCIWCECEAMKICLSAKIVVIGILL